MNNIIMNINDFQTKLHEKILLQSIINFDRNLNIMVEPYKKIWFIVKDIELQNFLKTDHNFASQKFTHWHMSFFLEPTFYLICLCNVISVQITS